VDSFSSMTARKYLITVTVIVAIAAMPSIYILLAQLLCGTSPSAILIEFRVLLLTLAAAGVTILTQHRVRFLNRAEAIARTLQDLIAHADHLGSREQLEDAMNATNVVRQHLVALMKELNASRLGVDEWSARLREAHAGLDFDAKKVRAGTLTGWLNEQRARAGSLRELLSDFQSYLLS
jgi:hypothetical protein